MARVNVGPVISEKSVEHPGYGAGPGTIDTTVCECPCGEGTWTKVRDNIPGFKESDYSLECKICREKYNFNPMTGDITEK